MTLPMLRILPPPWDFRMMTTPSAGSHERGEDYTSDKYEPIRKLAMMPSQPPRNPNKPFTSFRINDILSSESEAALRATPKSRKTSTPKQHINHIGQALTNGHRRHLTTKPRQQVPAAHTKVQTAQRHLQQRQRHQHLNNEINNRLAPVPPSRIVRPWDASPSPGKTSEASSDADDEEINVDDDDDDVAPAAPSLLSLKDVSPLDALMEMANKTFQGLETSEAADAKRREQAALFGKHSTPKKRRKSRTAFTNQQIYELEKRFLYQKYLTPADRDEIAQSLSLTNAQVITWFQNRRAKLKRDLEELKNDVVATKQISVKSVSSEHEFSIDSDSDCASSSGRPLHMSPKRSRSDSRSPEPRSDLQYDPPHDTPHDQVRSPCHPVKETLYESTDDIVVDDKDDRDLSSS